MVGAVQPQQPDGAGEMPEQVSAADQPWFVRNATIRIVFQVPSLDEYAMNSAERLFRKAATSGRAHIEEIARRDGPLEDYRRRPAAILDDPP